MAAQDQYRIWVKKVDAQHRIRLLADLGDVVSWVPKQPGSSIGCVGFPGIYGQMQLAPRELAGGFRASLRSALAARPATFDEASSEWAQFARYAAELWSVTLVFDTEPERYAITLPKGARDLEKVPKSGGVAVIFGMGQILEIWEESLWTKNIGEVARDVGAYAERAEEALLNRNPQS